MLAIVWPHLSQSFQTFTIGRFDGPRRQIFDVGERSCFGRLVENVPQVAIRLQAVQFGGFHQALAVGAGLGAMDGIAEQPVVAADDEGANGTLNAVVINFESPVFAVNDNSLPR